MNIKDVMKEWLELKGYDGLYCADVPCGCLKDDLFPCTYDHTIEECIKDCSPGYRKDFKESECCTGSTSFAQQEYHERCWCEGCGTDHWHIQEDKP